VVRSPRSILGPASTGRTDSPITPPGAEPRIRQEPKTLEAGAAISSEQTRLIEAINAYLDGFHFYNGRMNVQMEAHHYCSILNDDVIQCVNL
jgi:hypothetical protein